MKNLKIMFLPLLVMLVFNLQVAMAQQGITPAARKVLGAIQTMEVVYPQQKVYVHTDKEEYIAGESIWLKGYLVDATRHLPDTMKANLYVEVINLNEEPVNMIVLESDHGYADGYIQLHDSLPEGNYLLRAYTTYMFNFSQELFFEKEVFVHNPLEKNFIKRRDMRRNRRFNRKIEKQSEEVHFYVFPEGGHLVQGLENRVAFKAANGLGQAMDASGIVEDNNGEQVAAFEVMHQGMGSFSFTPQPGKSYRAIVEFAGGEREKVDMPQALAQGYLLKADIAEQQVDVEVKANFDPRQFNLSPEVFILGQTRSHAYFMKNGTLENGTFTTSIPLEILPTGTCQITLFDVNGQPLAERLVFVNHREEASVEIATRELEIDQMHALEVDVQFDPAVSAETDTLASYSLAVIGSARELESASSSIASYLLMTSDLNKVVQAPEGFFNHPSASTQQSMDLLMMTHGWRRFNWDQILAGNFPEIQYGRTSGLTVVGQVEPTSSAHPTGEIAVEMVVNQEGRNVHTTTTDEKGNFFFTDLFYNDFYLGQFSIPRDPMGRNLRIGLDSRDFRETDYKSTFGTRKKSVVSRGEHWERVKKPQTSFKSQSQLMSKEPTRIHGNADQVIYMQDLSGHYNNMMDILRSHATGLMLVDGQIMLRGPTSVNLSNEPMFMVDGVSTYRNAFLNIPPSELDRIEIIKGSGAAIYGVRGANGVIHAYTRRGTQQSQRTVDYMLIGFQSPRDFGLSNLQRDFYQETQVPLTLYWAPHVKPDANGNANVTFEMPEPARNIRIILEGIDTKGNIAFKEYMLKRE